MFLPQILAHNFFYNNDNIFFFNNKLSKKIEKIGFLDGSIY